MEFDFEVQQYSIEDIREELTRIKDYYLAMEMQEEALREALIVERQLSPDIVKESEAFYVDEDSSIMDIPDWMKVESLGWVYRNRYIAQLGRIVYPVKDNKGQVMGFCGWDKFETPKYLDSKNYGYTAKETTLYGMEKLPEYYVSNKPVFVVEGIVCCLYLRSKGYQALALLGSHMSNYVIQILKRFGSRLIVVPDNDEAGDSLVKQCHYKLLKCFIVQVKYGKDIDGCRKADEHIYEERLLKDLNNLMNPFATLDIFIRR